MHLVRPRGAALAEDLGRLTTPDRVSTRLPDRMAYARDLWVRGLIGARNGDMGAHPPEAVVWPATVEEVQAVMRWAAERGVPIVPFGAGSGVSGGTVPTNGGVVVDLKRMRRLLALDRQALTATFEAGIIGEHLEHELGRRGYTLGHFPSSIMCSTLGGWLAARSAGQCSSRYGKIEDMVRWVEVVLGTGEVVRTADPGALGPDFTQLLVGSEGTLGILTKAEMRIQPLAEERAMRGFSFPDLAAGCEAMRRVMQAGLRPFVMRLYDELDTFIAMRARHAEPDEKAPEQAMEPLSGAALLFERIDRTEGKALPGHAKGPLSHSLPFPFQDWLDALGGARLRQAGRDLQRWATSLALSRPELTNQAVDVLLPYLSGGCLMVVGVEGDRALAQAEWRAVEQELVRAGGRDLGPGPGERWLRRRYAINFGLSKVFDAGGFADTMEIATTWDRLLELHAAVRAAVAPHATVMAHFSHTYPEGCSIYYTFAATEPGEAGGSVGRPSREAQERRYDTIWREAMLATTRVGGTISHHHGIGLLKAPFMAGEHGEAMRVFHALKEALDPHDVCNPGKLGLEVGAAEAHAPVVVQADTGLGTGIGKVRAVLSRVLGGGGGRLADEADGATEVEALHVAPATAAEVVAVLEAAARHACPVVIGNGPWPGQSHLRLDLGNLTRILEINERSQLVHAQAGIRVGELEDALAARGLTLGPLLPRARGRRLGAVLASPRPSEASPRGRLLDACAALEAAIFTGTPAGTMEDRLATLMTTRLAPRRATGPAFEHALLGARGRTGVITSVWLRVMRKAPHVAASGWTLPSKSAAFDVAQGLLDRGGRPAVLTLIAAESATDVGLPGAQAKKAGDVVLLARCEGAEALVQAEQALLGELAQAAGGEALDPEEVSSWLAEPPTPPQGERFVPRTELPAAWTACSQASWLWALCPAGAALLTEPLAPAEPAQPEEPGAGNAAPIAPLTGSLSRPLAGTCDELARRLDPGSLLQANAHDA